MTLAPSPTERRAQARADLRIGLPVVITQGSQSALVAAVETLGADRFAQIKAMGAELAITLWRAKTLKARAYDGDLARLAIPAVATLKWAQAMADPTADLAHPMKGPFDEVRGGDAALARAALDLAKEAQLLPAVLLAPVDAALPLTQMDLDQATDTARFDDVVNAGLPTALAGQGRLHVYRPSDGSVDHYGIEVGRLDSSQPVLARLHSACFTGDVLGSLKCDCGPQLQAALRAMGAEGAGLLLYLNQEGRGIGLVNKMRAYQLQDQGFDTVEANHRLGFEDDERDFRIGAALLQSLRISRIRLMTNNPAKVAMMTAMGIEVVERVPLKVGQTQENTSYLATKAAKSGHLL